MAFPLDGQGRYVQMASLRKGEPLMDAGAEALVFLMGSTSLGSIPTTYQLEGGNLLVVVVTNAEFDAALLVTDQRDMDAVLDPRDMRPRLFLSVPPSLIERRGE